MSGCLKKLISVHQVRFRVCYTDWDCEADGIGRHKQARAESREVSGSANSSAGVGFCQGHHAVRPPLLLTLTEVLAQRGENPDLQTDASGPGAGSAGRAHVDKVVQRGVVRPARERAEKRSYSQIVEKNNCHFLTLSRSIWTII